MCFYMYVYSMYMYVCITLNIYAYEIMANGDKAGIK